jgi:hypothetical protein
MLGVVNAAAMPDNPWAGVVSLLSVEAQTTTLIEPFAEHNSRLVEAAGIPITTGTETLLWTPPLHSKQATTTSEPDAELSSRLIPSLSEPTTTLIVLGSSSVQKPSIPITTGTLLRTPSVEKSRTPITTTSLTLLETPPVPLPITTPQQRL